jgi:hypothetical protein
MNMELFPDSIVCFLQWIHHELTVKGSVDFGLLAAFCKHSCQSGVFLFGDHVIFLTSFCTYGILVSRGTKKDSLPWHCTDLQVR